MPFDTLLVAVDGSDASLAAVATRVDSTTTCSTLAGPSSAP